MSKNYLICPNCEESIDREDQYCSHCGQFQSEEITVGLLFRNAIGNFLSADARLFKSIWPLVFRPFELSHSFISGKRQKYLHPVKFYFFASFVFFFLLSLATGDWEERLVDILEDEERFEEILTEEAQDSSLALDVAIDNAKSDSIQVQTDSTDVSLLRNWSLSRGKIDSLRAARKSDVEVLEAFGVGSNAPYWKKILYLKVIKFTEKSGLGLFPLVLRAIPIAMFLMLPVFALLLCIVFLGRRRYAECLVFSLYQFSFQFLLFASSIFALAFLHGMEAWVLIIFVISFLYLLRTIKYFFKRGYFVSFFGTGVVIGIYSSLVIPFSIFIVTLIAFILY